MRGNIAMKRYYVWTIGCQMNEADSAHLAAELEAIGYRLATCAEDADVIVLNTCVVRQSAEDKAIGRLWSLAPLKARRPETVIGLMGCVVGYKPSAQLRARFPMVDVFMPPSEPGPLVEYLRERSRLENGSIAAWEQETLHARYELQDSLEAESVRSIARRVAGVTAHLPIIFGCNHLCTFCIIPYRRGPERSRPLAEILAEARILAAQGVKEVTLLGQIVDRYGYDFDGLKGHGLERRQPSTDLADLLAALHEVDGLERIRFLTSHPNYMSDRILDAVVSLPKVCEHIEVPVQAGHDEVLGRMRRGYTVDDYRRLIYRIREKVPDAGIATDVIVGFPGETEAQFQATYDLLAELKLDVVHVAMYSPRPGTAAARHLADDVPQEEKKRRLHAINDLQECIVGEINRRLVGQTVEVLVEDKDRQRWRGRTRANKLVFFEAEGDWRGKLAQVKITWAGPWSMLGEPVVEAAADEPIWLTPFSARV
jgi:tRNA-2-methylthio-N6-dimethylallyladenosine synthase